MSKGKTFSQCVQGYLLIKSPAVQASQTLGNSRLKFCNLSQTHPKKPMKMQIKEDPQQCFNLMPEVEGHPPHVSAMETTEKINEDNQRRDRKTLQPSCMPLFMKPRVCSNQKIGHLSLKPRHGFLRWPSAHLAPQPSFFNCLDQKSLKHNWTGCSGRCDGLTVWEPEDTDNSIWR